MTEILNLTEKQISKIKTLVEKAEMNFESDNENKCSIYNFYAHRYGIIIIDQWGADNDSQYSVIDSKTKAQITGKDLDLKIQEIINEYSKSKRTLEHAENDHSGKFHTITSTAYIHPNAKLLNAILQEAKIEVPMNVKIEAARRFMQQTYSELKDLTLEQQIIRQCELQAGLQACNDLIAQGYKKVHKTKALKLEEAHRAAQIKATKKQPRMAKTNEPKVKMSKLDQGIWNIIGKNATQEQFETKKAQMRAMGLLDILEDSKNSSDESKKFNISTTSVKEQTFGENSGS